MRVDLHVHSKERSPCAVSGEDDIIRAAITHGLGGLVFTDHDRLVPRERIAELQQEYSPFCVFGGIEVSVSREHVLVLGVDDVVLEQRQWTYPDLHAFVRERGGYLVLAHPFRYRDSVNIDLETYRPDAIELHSTNIRPTDESRIHALAESLGVRLVCNSDAHRASDIGRYHNLLLEAPRDVQGLVQILAEGNYQCDAVASST